MSRPPFFRLKPVDPEFRSKHHFKNVVVVDGVPEQVFDTLVDGKTEAEWFPDFKGIEWMTPPPHGEGSSREYRLSYMRILEHFTVWERGKRVVFWVSRCSLPMMSRFMEDYRLEAVGADRTRIEWTVHYTPLWCTAWIRPVLHPLFARDFRRASEQLSSCCARRFKDAADASETGRASP